ncbi:hypothetical protein KY331_05360 [Candidatus Woesearchaeota archaeon]|nr:hypothetical protein [Candidatus Woesearchaeota archaeon]
MLEKILKKTSLIDLLIIVIASLAIVSIWRGVWGLMDMYLLPENPTLSLLISIVVGLVILFTIAFYNKER